MIRGPIPFQAGESFNGHLSLQKKTSLWLLHTKNTVNAACHQHGHSPAANTPSHRLAWSLNVTVALFGFPPPPVRQLGTWSWESLWLWTCSHLPRAFCFSCVGLHLKTSTRDIPTRLDIPVCSWWEFCLLYLKRQLCTRGTRSISGCKP